MTTPLGFAEEIAANLKNVRMRIHGAATKAGRSGQYIALVAVSKGHGEDAIVCALEAGQRVFGENRIQEAQAKWPALKARWPDVELHLIGPLQTNKVIDALELFDVIETVDREKLGAKLGAQKNIQGHQFLVQVNTGEEPQKAGAALKETDALIKTLKAAHGIHVDGLMCIPPHDEEPAMHFALLAKLASRNNLGVLSMGMSQDFETAIAFGATHVRVGTAIFGTRVPKSG